MAAHCPPSGHLTYHVDNARTCLGLMVRAMGKEAPRAVLEPLAASIYNLQSCTLDMQRVALEVHTFARAHIDDPSIQRAAAGALFELIIMGPCIDGDRADNDAAPPILARFG